MICIIIVGNIVISFCLLYILSNDSRIWIVSYIGMWIPIVIALYITTDMIVIKKIAVRTSGKLIDFIWIVLSYY